MTSSGDLETMGPGLSCGASGNAFEPDEALLILLDLGK
jgi:hypothetical protein